MRAIPPPEEIAARIARGEEGALARLISALEDGEPWAGAALRLLRKGAASLEGDTRSSAIQGVPVAPARSPLALVLGITGPPGSGKSTLADRLIMTYRERGERVGVLAVDPSSPFSGGAILGDRIRMRAGEGVFIRSLASRGRLGGLSRAAAQAARALEAARYGVVLVETVGIGQSEVDIARLADIVVLLSTPGSGDEIQAIKAGVTEIGEVFVVNKADREGADRAVREIRAMLELSPASAGGAPGAELPPVVKTIAETGEGVGELVAILDARWAALKASGELERRRARGAAAEARALLSERVAAALDELEGGLEAELAERIVKGEIDAEAAADALFASLLKNGDKA
jgi:LAO/AO transport system kinase